MRAHRNSKQCWRSILIIALAATSVAVLTGDLLSRSVFPSGADPGQMLAHSFALEGRGFDGELAYAPGLPWLMLALRHLAGDNVPMLLWLVKVVGVMCLFTEAAGLAAFAGVLGGGTAARWTFVLAAFNPNSWNQLLWGGYAQLLAVGAGSGGLALLLKGLTGRRSASRYLPFAGVLFGVVILVHAYSAFFFAIVATGMVVSRFWQNPGRALLYRALATATVAALVALPSVPAYFNLIRDLHLPRTFQLGAQAYGVSLAEVAQNMAYHPAVNVLMGLLFVLVVAVGKRSTPDWPKKILRPLMPFLLASVILLVATPPLHVARAGLFLWHGAVLFMGITLAGATRVGLSDVTPRLGAAVLAVVCLTPIVSYADLTTLHADYAPLGKEEAEAMLALGGSATGRTLVVSPNPNIDGWWYEGITGRPALIGDHLRWYLLGEQQERSIAAQTIVHSTVVLDGGSMRLMALSLREGEVVTALWVKDDTEYYPLIQIRAQLESMDGRGRVQPKTALPTVDLASGQSENEAHFTLVEQTAAGDLVWQAKGGTAEVILSWHLEQATSPSLPHLLSAVIEPSPGVRLRRAVRERESFLLRCEFLYDWFRLKGLERTVEIEVTTNTAWSSSFPPEAVRIERELRESDLRREPLELRLRIHGIRPAGWRVVAVEDLVSKWNVSHVWVRGVPAASRRFELDGQFQQMWEKGQVTAFRVRNLDP